MTATTRRATLGRRVFTGGLLAAPSILSRVTQTSAAEPQTLRIMVQNPIIQTDYLHLISERAGIFARHGIKSEFTSSTSPILPLLAGDVDITSIGSSAGLVAIVRKQDFEFVAATVPHSTIALLTHPDSPLTKNAHRWPDSFTQLKGKTLGVTVAGAQIDLTARWIALLAGLKPDQDITVQAAGDATTLLGGLEKGVYDAGLVPSPLFELAEARNVAVSILDFYRGEGPQELWLLPYAAPAARKTYADKNPEIINKYIASVQEASDMARDPANRDKIMGIIAQELKVDPAKLNAAMDTFIHAIGSVKFSREQWNTAIAMMKANGIVKQDYAYEANVFAGARV